MDNIQVLDENGSVDASLFPEGLDDGKILEMYRYMSLARALDNKILSLQRQGRAVTYGPMLGEEATQIGSAMAMRENDIFVPNFRQHGVFLLRGMPIELILLYWKGYEEGCMIPEKVRGFPYIVPVASQMPHAMGIAFAQKYKKSDVAVIGYVGDGGTSEGDFYETLNFAGAFKLPLVTIIENNQWAISMPRARQSAAETLAQKGIAAGIKCVQVDGNDVIGVYKVVKEAIANAKDGPTVIECVTYRMSMHTTADDPTKYRSQAEVDAWKPRDPIDRARRYLSGKALWSPDFEAKMQEEQAKVIDEAVAKAEAWKPDPKSIFEHVYSYMPEVLKEEYDEAVANDFWQGEVSS
ncbi:MAG: pyruvate dehydrogenase (acetyl-transferring) E1 component subunit alpha [Candidatus Micrarchaeota archaeon]|nr:pyruvate dehydrogenase (acetyl-transferring) E1 component subunit alpha [Candidatus Micrarchaeota archaeon]MDE1848301.1 pyruvate dehydrogenase (acetyl-transferring) E1 component subunit alpha [Candidatus Micrarchaeota archaeon]MDE1864754.1 pyruvate dehydrogenase (acetyl-transferring) E1 component subunit alpha [Candidatus Micrarchaeota archaeon]